ncbi:MAG: diaminopropionate ammonia-lyase [Angelakisella sp.]|jgi:diaminopropionate ammonia-lyase|nr:diaminopropionate ammonia-lyase [Angelakisella sp.]
MDGCFKLVSPPRPAGARSDVTPFGVETAKRTRAFHASFPEYSVTPLADLSGLAKELGLGGVYVKDESYRFGLNAFKVLGGSFAIGSYLAGRLGVDIGQLPYDRMTGKETREKLGDITFVTATDGNHGRGVAWTANRLGQKSVVYMPKGSALERLENIRALGSDASITELNYDDAVRLANQGAEKYGWVMVQDTAWEGYEDIPRWIMQGYTTLALEATEQLRQLSVEKPTHIFLQAGVGAMSGGITGFLRDCYGDEPVITIVEPNKADCIYRSARAGERYCVTGEMQTIMAGLACGEPCTIGWDILRDHADHFISCPEYVAAKGMRVLGNPVNGDTRVVSGESGAVTLGLVAELMQNPSLDWLREPLGLGSDSRVLCISTEGDTDRENYRRIVWDGAWPSF